MNALTTQTDILNSIVDAPSVGATVGQPALVEIRGKDYPIQSIADASAKWTQIRNLTHMGASQMPHIAILDTDRNYLGHIGYNGSFCSVYDEMRYGIRR